jgi:hypothetical protein
MARCHLVRRAFSFSAGAPASNGTGSRKRRFVTIDALQGSPTPDMESVAGG